MASLSLTLPTLSHSGDSTGLPRGLKMQPGPKWAHVQGGEHGPAGTSGAKACTITLVVTLPLGL